MFHVGAQWGLTYSLLKCLHLDSPILIPKFNTNLIIFEHLPGVKYYAQVFICIITFNIYKNPTEWILSPFFIWGSRGSEPVWITHLNKGQSWDLKPCLYNPRASALNHCATFQEPGPPASSLHSPRHLAQKTEKKTLDLGRCMGWQLAQAQVWRHKPRSGNCERGQLFFFFFFEYRAWCPSGSRMLGAGLAMGRRWEWGQHGGLYTHPSIKTCMSGSRASSFIRQHSNSVWAGPG